MGRVLERNRRKTKYGYVYEWLFGKQKERESKRKKRRRVRTKKQRGDGKWKTYAKYHVKPRPCSVVPGSIECKKSRWSNLFNHIYINFSPSSPPPPPLQKETYGSREKRRRGKKKLGGNLQQRTNIQKPTPNFSANARLRFRPHEPEQRHNHHKRIANKIKLAHDSVKPFAHMATERNSTILRRTIALEHPGHADELNGSRVD